MRASSIPSLGVLVAAIVAVTVTTGAAAYWWLIRVVLENVLALAQVHLPAAALATLDRWALLVLVLGTATAAVTCYAVARMYARHFAQPLAQLTEAARNISRGNLATPIPIPSEPAEIAALAVAFDESRAETHHLLQSLRRANEWSETLLHSIVEGIVTVDVDGCITSFSDGAERMTGWKAQEVLHRPINDVLPLPEGDGHFTDHLPEAGGVTEVSVVTRNARDVMLAASCTRLKFPDDESTQLALVLRDITNEEAARRLRSYFLANISHEFRTPLSALNASIQLLMEDLENLPPAQILELLNSVRLSVSGLQSLIDNLLESASIEAGRFRIRRRMAEPDEVVAEAVRVMQPLLERRHQTLCVSKPAIMPPAYVDPTRLTQVLVNLLSNASKYSPMEATIELGLSVTDEGALHGSVADRGPGVPPAERAHLFRQFVRLNGHDGTQYGVGLGLSVVKAIVEGHSGHVGVDDRPEGGAVFWFKIPLDEHSR
jgi:PAS domain S-box-containing protein